MDWIQYTLYQIHVYLHAYFALKELVLSTTGA